MHEHHRYNNTKMYMVSPRIKSGLRHVVTEITLLRPRITRPLPVILYPPYSL